ncbi:LysR family transcriptional regulator, partial [Thiohalobacter sp.]|uniref:LysR family transcriptional regulator n=1 Tax=Thiohalobacter sp. TaxID=2025948 RepID=UPI00260F573D
MHLTLQQLRLFQSVVRNGSFTRAAEEMHLTQPAVSIQIRRLEDQAGTPLLEQVGKKIFPTAAGKTVFAAAGDVLARLAELDNEIEILKGEVRGPLQIAVVTTGKYFMPHLLGQFLQQHPGVEPHLKFTNRERVMERLLANEDDFVVMGQVPDDDRLVSYPFLENILGFVAPPDHPLAERKCLRLEEVIQERFIAREPGSGTRQVIERLLAEQGLSAEPYMELGSAEAIKQAVLAGIGVAVLSLHSVRLEQAAGKLVVLGVEGFPIKRRWYAVHQKGKRLSLVAQTFLDFILTESHQVLDEEDGHG